MKKMKGRAKEVIYIYICIYIYWRLAWYFLQCSKSNLYNGLCRQEELQRHSCTYRRMHKYMIIESSDSIEV